MRRALVFLLLGPLAVAIAATVATLPPGRVDAGIAWTTGALVFLMTLPISVVVGVIDACLARRVSVALRPSLTAAAGAIIPCLGLIVFAHAALVPSFLLPFAICGAAAAGLCALYADGLGLRSLQPANPVNP